MSVAENCESLTAQKWIQWCQTRTLTKCTEYTVPDGILPDKYHGVLVDVKVHGTKRFSGPDDKIYSENDDLRQKVARGNCALELHYPTPVDETGDTKARSKSEIKYLFLVFALRKFSGGLGDEDDNQLQNMWQRYFIDGIESSQKVICTTKANGEAAHVSCREIGGKNYFCVGSKNVHLLARNMEDVSKYKDGRFEIARIVAEAFFEHAVNQMGPEIFQRLQEFLVRTRFTMVCELLQPNYQHIVNLSYLDHPELQFICWAEPYTDSEYTSLCGMPPDEAIELARSFKLQTIEFEVMPKEDAEAEMSKIRSERGYEGKVLYFVDNSNNVIGLLKKKTCWYIILRAIREKTAHFASPKSNKTTADVQTAMTKRIKAIQTWIGFSNEYRSIWNELGTAFIRWVANERRRAIQLDFRAKFPVIWAKFLESSDKHKAMYENLQFS